MSENTQQLSPEQMVEKAQDIINSMRAHIQNLTDALISSEAENTALRRKYNELAEEVTKAQAPAEN